MQRMLWAAGEVAATFDTPVISDDHQALMTFDYPYYFINHTLW